MGFLGYFSVATVSHILLFYAIHYYFFTPDDETRNKIFNEMVDKLIDSIPQMFEELDPFPVNSYVASVMIDFDEIHLNVKSKDFNTDYGHLRYTISLDEKSKIRKNSFIKTFEWLFKSHPLWNQAGIFWVQDSEKQYKFYYLKYNEKMQDLENFSVDYCEDLYPRNNSEYNPDEPDSGIPPVLTSAGKNRIFFNFEDHVKRATLEINLSDKSDGLSEFDRELSKKEKAENELAKFLYYLSNSGIVKNLTNKKRLDSSFGYFLDYGVNENDEFWYTLETYKLNEGGSKVVGSEKDEEVYNPAISDVLEKAGATVIKIDPESRKLYIQNPEITLSDQAVVNLTIPPEGTVKLDTTNKSVSLDTTDKKVTLNTGTSEVVLKVPKDASVDLKTTKSDGTMKNISLYVDSDMEIPLQNKNHDGSLKKVELLNKESNGDLKQVDLNNMEQVGGVSIIKSVDLRNYDLVNGQSVLKQIDLKNKEIINDVEVLKEISISGLGTDDWNGLIKDLFTRQEKLKTMDQNSLDAHILEYGSDVESIRLLEKFVAKYQKQRMSSIVNDNGSDKDLIARENTAWVLKYGSGVKSTFEDSYGSEVEIKQGYYANQDPLVKAYTEINHQKLGENQGDIYIAKNLFDLEENPHEVSKEVENLEVVKSKLPVELTDYEIVEKVGEKFFDNSEVQNVDGDLDLNK